MFNDLIKAIGSISMDIKIGGALVAALAVIVGVNMMKQKQSSPTDPPAKTVSIKQEQSSSTVPPVKPAQIKQKQSSPTVAVAVKPAPVVNQAAQRAQLIEGSKYLDLSNAGRHAMHECFDQHIAMRQSNRDIRLKCQQESVYDIPDPTPVKDEPETTTYTAPEPINTDLKPFGKPFQITKSLPACQSFDYWDRLMGYKWNGDGDAGTKMLQEGFATGECRGFDAGATVYKTDWNIKGFIKIREQGDTTEYWTLKAIEE
jgi:hypothetical protein